jgi:hypothetical protein
MARCSRFIASAALLILPLAACSPGSSTPPSPSSSEAISASPSTPTPPSTSTVTPGVSGSGTSQPESQLVDPNGGTVVCEKASDDTLTISQYPRTGGSLTLVLSIRPWDIMVGWKPPIPLDSTGECANPLLWSPDFRWHLEVGTPPGTAGAGPLYHVVLIDTVSKTFTDLTALRQGSGFSDPVLSERNPMFISDAPSERISFGSNVIVMSSNAFPSGNASVDRRTPTIASDVATATGGTRTLIAGHPETALAGIGTSYVKASPGGKYLAEDRRVSPAPDFKQQIALECLDPNDFFPTTLGWIDPTHVIVTSGSSQAMIVDVVSTPKPTCQPIIPPTDKNIYGMALSEDGTTLTFDADNASGGRTTYAVPVSSPLSAPKTIPRTSTPVGTVFRPGNF